MVIPKKLIRTRLPDTLGYTLIVYTRTKKEGLAAIYAELKRSIEDKYWLKERMQDVSHEQVEFELGKVIWD